MNFSIRSLRPFATRLLSLSLFVAGTAGALAPAAVPPPAKVDANAVLLSAASPFEDMTEFALDSNLAGIDGALKAYAAQSAQVDVVLTAAQRARLHARTAAIATARGATDHAAIALNAVEAYGILVRALRPQELKVPIQVANLDYAGFKLKVLTQGGTRDWSAARAVSQGASADWAAIKSRVTDHALRDAMDVTIAGMHQATGSRNNDMAALAAEIDLALVDLLEAHFEAAPK